jgi:hypothetical protein|tara:strand:+ start:2223 stop:2435 length:213 start_codon:yes stop_codon:yes gene_type:complete
MPGVSLVKDESGDKIFMTTTMVERLRRPTRSSIHTLISNAKTNISHLKNNVERVENLALLAEQRRTALGL